MTGHSPALRHARADDAGAVIAFLDAHWGEPHPLVHVPEWFSFYYRPFGEDGPLQFAVAEQDGAIAAVAGYIRANACETPDIWVSIWCADKAHSGCGMELLGALPRLAGARFSACNNIRPKVRPLYQFLGYTAQRMGHFYRLADRASYMVAQIAHKEILPAGGSAELVPLPDETALRACGYVPNPARRPYKDVWYLTRRYFHYPHQRYDVWGVREGGAVTGLLVTRTIPVEGTHVLRIADYTGAPEAFAHLGGAVDRLIAESGAEYADCYCAGVPAEIMAAAGFSERRKGDANILPNYLAPLVRENTDYYFAAGGMEHFTMFKADGDQDRPYIPI